jgi:eukaryotic-like serine/threonine-protein kinase
MLGTAANLEKRFYLRAWRACCLNRASMRTPIAGQVTGHEQTVIGLASGVRYEVGAVLCEKYRLDELLGEGGMGAVWRASNVLLDLPVAIKLIRADLDRDSLRARLQLEARAAAKLGHPAIVRIFDVGESDFGDPFIVMELLRGETLAQLISRGRLPATRAVQLLLPIIDALAAAHARGIVHRDLKPDNVMIALEEQHVRPKILDFGIAKLTDPCDSNLKLTEVGAVVGSPEYMSPEQARGRDDIDASTDIWSICVVLYEAITGCPPFSATNCNALLRSIVEDTPKAFSEHALEDTALWRILERGLQKERAQRYATISELGQALASWLLTQDVTEDACGTSLDSKWFGRKGHLLSSSQAALALRTSDAAPPSIHDSSPDSTGTVRGPFTKTVPPNAHNRTRTLSAVVAVCGLLAVALLALGGSPRARAKDTATLTSNAISAPVRAASTPPAPHPEATPEPARAKAEPEVRPITRVEAEAQPKAAAVRPSKPLVSPVRLPSQPLPLAASSAPAVSGRAERPLDLLPPY